MNSLFVYSMILITAINAVQNQTWAQSHALAMHDISVFYDPFYYEQNLHCDEQASALLTQLQAFQFKGIIMQPQSPDGWYQKIWLIADKLQLMASTEQVPNELLPWAIQSIRLDMVIGQAHLPDSCDQLILWKMPLISHLNGKKLLDHQSSESIN